MSGTIATRGARVAGVDLARAVAVAGMMTVHVLPSTSTGVRGVLYEVAHGRASGLFAVLAGVSLGLATRGTGPGRADRAGARTGVLVRGALVALLGLFLVLAGSRIAIILPYYGLAFALVLPFLFARARTLLPLALVWLALSPVASLALRRALGVDSQTEQPTPLWLLAAPGRLLETLLLTGYYPVLGWTGYLLLGLAVSRLDLRERAAGVRVLGGGLVLAAGAWTASALALGPLGGAARLAADVAPADLGTVLGEPFYGTLPTSSWWWLAVVAPHSGSPPDLLHTSGTALAVLGALLLLPRVAVRVLSPVAALGSVPLSAYALHVVVLAAYPGDSGTLLAVHVVGACVLASVWRATVGRGPLETLVGDAGRAGAALVRGPSR
ncbi:heparan-alpha-glucosaminide N-acetyltransferase domain-containing protein [Kineococcus sp. SYSU DK004]|uniref:heparan-alpha-glucosaminide N-acetyltransferase domain-containing protein n=1 Tax=Kineococcus sp. SYSU DK004 TaxID=3383125 RepID=UPI003D7CEA1D